MRARRDQVLGQDCVHPDLKPCALLHQMYSASCQQTSTAGLVISDPGLGQVRAEELGKDPGVVFVGLDVRLGDCSRLARV